MKLLVNAPTGVQELIEIGIGGGYFDAARVLWDERTDGALPGITLGGMVRVDGALVFDQSRMDQHTDASKPPVPQSVTMRQARLALLGAGLLPSVNAAIAAMPEPDKQAATITWEFAATVDRGFGMVPQLAAALGMTETQIDDLFIAAAQI